MTSQDEEHEGPRSPLRAGVGDLVLPGLGHWYLGEIRQAIAIAAFYVLVFPLLIVALVAIDRGLVLAVGITVGAAWLLRVLAAIHAVIVAKRREPFEPSAAHTSIGYALFILVVAGFGWWTTQQLRERVLETFQIPAESGLPNIDKGDHIIVTKLTSRDRAAQRGDLITFEVPGQKAIFVKRVVAVGGETVSMRGGVVAINGVPFETSPCDEAANSGRSMCLVERTPEGAAYRIQFTQPEDYELYPRLVPAGSVFVLGDNRLASLDSREFGPVSLEVVTGRARAIWLPFTRMASLDP